MLLVKLPRIRLLTYVVAVVILALHLRSRKQVVPADLSGNSFTEITTTDLRNPTLPRLHEDDRFPMLYRAAAATVRRAIEKEGLRPEEYFVELRIQDAEKILRFELWHESIIGENYDVGWRGDRSGKSRTVHYDAINDQVLTIHAWR